MSYILDALKKADAQRERDPATRGIHAQPVSTATAGSLHGPAAARWRWGLAGVAGAGLVAVAAWQLTTPSGPTVADDAAAPQAARAVIAATPASAITPAVSPASAVLPAPAVVPTPPAALRASAALPATAALPAPAVLPAAPPPAPPTVARAIPLPTATAPTVSNREAGRSSGAASGAAFGMASAPVPRGSASPATVPLVAAEVPQERVWAVNELPADLQRELPKLAISGGVYSDNPAQRMLIVNGQVLGEGAEPSPGVLLEQIRAKTAVLKFRGYRYAVGY